MLAMDEVEGVLGYRGFIIEANSDEQAASAKLPDSFRVGGLVHQSFVAAQGVVLPLLSSQESDQTALWLLTTAKGVVEDEVLRYVESVIKQRVSGFEVQEQEANAEEPELPRAFCLIRDTPYNPGFWNRPFVQPYNNCYNYAMNWRSDTFAQPGRISGHPNNVMQCANVAAAANFDGCVTNCASGRSYKIVALVVWPGIDYHWYRLHSNGFWGHKPGSTPARNTDNSGRIIGGSLNPYNCDRGPYTDFCGYRLSPTGMQVR
jgi:hypothetical protein